MRSTSHQKSARCISTANCVGLNPSRRCARKEGVEYNEGQGPDVTSARRAIEVETADTVRDGLRQLQGFNKPVYLAGADAEATKAALEAAQGTTVGVMNSQGKILKRSTRRRHR